MDFIRNNRWIAWLLIVFGGGMMAASCFDRGVMDLDDTRILTKVCSDYPVGEAPADCVTSREVLDENDAVDSWPLFIVGLLLLASGLAIITGTGPFKREPDMTIRHREQTGGLPALLLLQDSSLIGSGAEGWEGGLATFGIVALVLLALILGFLWLRKNRRSGGAS